MPPPRRSSRIDLRPPTPQGTSAPALDTAPDLAADDLRRSGSAGLLLLAVGAAVFGLGVGLLGIPLLMGGGKKAERKRSPKETDAPAPGKEASRANGGASEAKESPVPQDSNKLFPHRNLLPAGLLVPAPEAKTSEPADAAGPEAAKTETPQVAEAKTPAPGTAEPKNVATPATPEPGAQPPESAGPFRLVTLNGFDERKTQGWQNGTFQSDPTFKKSPWSWLPDKIAQTSYATLLRAPDIPKEASSGKDVPNFGKHGDGYVLNVQVYAKNIEALRLDLMDGTGGVLGDIKILAPQLKDADWTELHLELDKAKPAKDAKPDAPVIGLRLTFLGDKSKKGSIAAAIDEASVTIGGTSEEAAKAAAEARAKALAEAEKAAQAEALKQALTGEPGRDGFLLAPEILDTYKRLVPGGGAAKPGPKAKEIARLVSGGAASSSFLVPLGAKDGDLKEADGYIWRAAGAAMWRDPAGAAREVERYLADGNPEVLVLAADPDEVVARRKHPYEYFAELSCAVDAAMKRGVLPVLVSPVEDIESAPEKSEKRARLASVRKLVVELGETRRIPVLDAGALLDEKSFVNGRVQAAGYQKLNEAFLKLYRKLERYVLPREGFDRSAAPKAGLPGLPGFPAGPAKPPPAESKTPAIGVED